MIVDDRLYDRVGPDLGKLCVYIDPELPDQQAQTVLRSSVPLTWRIAFRRAKSIHLTQEPQHDRSIRQALGSAGRPAQDVVVAEFLWIIGVAARVKVLLDASRKGFRCGEDDRNSFLAIGSRLYQQKAKLEDRADMKGFPESLRRSAQDVVDPMLGVNVTGYTKIYAWPPCSDCYQRV